LNLAVNSTTTSITDVTICSNQLPYSWNGIDYSVAGTYTFVTTNAAGCDSVATLNLGVNAITSSRIDITVCSSQLPYRWNGRDYAAAGTYTFTTTNAIGCDSVATLNLSVNRASRVDTAASACDSFTWDRDGRTYTLSGDYAYTFVNGVCTDTIILHLTINTANLTVNDPSAVCSPNTVDLTAASLTVGSDNGLDYTYWTNSDATIPLSNPNAVAISGTYYIKANSASACSVTKPVVVTINAAPSLLVTNPANVCAPGTVDLTNPAITAGSDPGLSLTYWTDAANTVPVVDPKAVGASGTYYITATTAAGCSSTQSVEVVVTVNKAAPGMRYPTVTTAPNTSTQLNARELGSNYNYSWYPPVGLNFTDVKSPTFNYDLQTQYTITLTPADGTCPTVDTLLVTVRKEDLGCKSKIDVPKAWSPNGDGHNDKLYPLTICIKELKYFRVFNRWGQLMFETTTIGQGWDGMFNGSPQVMDVYTWILEADGVDGVHYKQAGNSILMR
jgi:gliding motility-associated-like protein